jgi:hypothetical protein
MAPKLIGGYEAIYNGGLKWVKPNGNHIEYGDIGVYECSVCGTQAKETQNKYGEKKKPHTCPNTGCGRKKTMELSGPTHLQKPIWPLPGKPIECTETELFDELGTFFRECLVLQEPEYDTLCLWVMASWLVDDFQTCPYLALIAPKSSGKTRVMDAIRETAYRAFSTTSVTPAALVRSVELWNITLCIDEAQDIINSKTEAGQAIYSCLLSGYKRGMPALRSGDGSSGFMPESFDVFGFKAFSGTKLVLPTLESRSITLELRRAKPKRMFIDEERSLKLRSMLLHYRFTHLSKMKLVLPDLKSGRVIELFTPICTVAQSIGCGESINEMISRVVERDQAEEEQSLEAQIIQAITDVERTEDPGSFGKRAMIFIKEIVDELGMERNQRSSVIVGRHLKVMQIITKHTSLGNGIDLQDNHTVDTLTYLQDRYGVI